MKQSPITPSPYETTHSWQEQTQSQRYSSSNSYQSNKIDEQYKENE